MQSSPWDLVGTYLEDKDSLHQRATSGLDWSLDTREIAYKNKLNKWKIDRSRLALVRSDTDRLLNVVGENYELIDIFQVFRLANNLPGKTLSYAWCLDEGDSVGIAKRQEKYHDFWPYFHIYTTFPGKSALKIEIVYVTDQGIVVPTGMDTSVAVRHKMTSEVNIDNTINRADEILQESNERLAVFDSLAMKNFTRDKALDLIKRTLNCHSAIKHSTGRKNMILAFFALHIGLEMSGQDLLFLACSYWDKYRKVDSQRGRWNLIMRKEALGYSHKAACLNAITKARV